MNGQYQLQAGFIDRLADNDIISQRVTDDISSSGPPIISAKPELPD